MQNSNDEIATLGIRAIVDEIPEPMRLIMRENSRALDQITNSIPCSRSPKPLAYQDPEKKDATASEQ